MSGRGDRARTDGWLTIALAVLSLFWVGWALVPPGPVPTGAVHLGVVVVVGLAAAVHLLRRRPAVSGPPVIATALALLSLAVASVVEPGRFPRAERLDAALTGMAHGVTFLAVLALVPRRSEGRPEGARRLLVGALAALLASQGAAGWAQADEVTRLAGTLGNPNVLGAVAAASALALAAWLRWRPWALAALSPAVLLVLGTRSRGAVAAATGVLLVFAVRRSWRLVLVVLAVTALVVVVPNPLRDRVIALPSDHLYPRPFVWGAAWESIQDHPLGIGPGMNRHAFPARAYLPDRPWLLHQRHEVGLTHNVFLTLALEWGWLAGLSLVALCAWSARVLWTRAPTDRLGQGAALAAAALLLELQWDGLEQNALVFSLFVTLVAVALGRAPGGPGRPAVPGARVGWGLLAASVLLVAAGVPRTRADVALRAADRAVVGWQRDEVSLVSARAAVAEAERLAGGRAAAARLRARLELRHLRALLDEEEAAARSDEMVAVAETIETAFERARRLDPASVGLAREQAEWLLVLYRRGGRSPAVLARWFETMGSVLERDPLDVVARWELAQRALAVGRRDLFDRHTEALLAIEPDDARAWAARARVHETSGCPDRALHAWVRAREAVFNARVKAAIDSPRSRAYYEGLLAAVDLDLVRRRIGLLRRQLYR